METLLLLTILLVGLAAGMLGAVFGIGGGIIIIPCMTALYGLTATEAAAVSLVGIVATSVGGTVFYLENRVTNIRLGLYLEISTVIGAAIGVLLAGCLQEWVIMSIFTAVIVASAVKMILDPKTKVEGKENGEFSYHDVKSGEDVGYDVEHKYSGLAICTAAGVISSLTGVGGGLIKVPVMNMYMKVPMKAAAATSSYMIGITAFSGAIIYFLNGQVILDVAAFVAVGTFLGAVIGSRISRKFDGSALKKYFSILLFAVAVVMILQIGGVI